MLYANLSFEKLPEIGFALQHYSKQYGAGYGRSKNVSVEIAYISSGSVEIYYKEQKLIANEGSIIVLFRNLDIHTITSGNEIQSHYTVLGEFEDAQLEISDDEETSFDGLTVPFVTPFCAATEKIVSKICSIAQVTSCDRDKNIIVSSVDFLSVLCDISKLHNDSRFKNKAYKKVAVDVCEYVRENLHKQIRVEEIAKVLSKSTNYVGSAFKNTYGISINEYINNQKMKKAALLMQCDNMSFADAVSAVGIKDVSYAYRLFKRYFGMSPNKFASIKSIKRKNLEG